MTWFLALALAAASLPARSGRPPGGDKRIELARTYLQKVRETQDFGYLDRAERIAGEILERDSDNYEAQRILSQIWLERHEFRKAAGSARRLIARQSADPHNYGVLGDALIELGDYEGAADAYQKMVDLRPDLSSYNRAAHYRFLEGDLEGAIALMEKAVNAASLKQPEPLAWCLAQLGELYFKQGNLDRAGQAFEAGRRVFPNHYGSLAGLAQVAAARGRFDDAIDFMKRSIAVVPLLDHVALLSDYYEFAGRPKEAAQQWKLVEFLERLGVANREAHHRDLARVYLNRNVASKRALDLALRELEVRGDIYTWDVIAWGYFRNQKYAEAEEAMEKALRMGTEDPALHYHAGMIARSLGRHDEARRRLERALGMNPAFDLRQAAVARRALSELQERSGQ